MIERDTTRQFKLVSKYKPAGDQPEAIRQLVEGINHHEKAQVLQMTMLIFREVN